MSSIVHALSEGHSGCGHFGLGSSRIDLGLTRTLNEPLVLGRQLGNTSLGLRDFLSAESGRELSEVGLECGQIGSRFGFACLEVEGFEFDEGLAGGNRVALLNEDLGDASANAGSNCVASDRSWRAAATRPSLPRAKPHR